MTQPYYTTVQTQGPADPVAPAAAKLYTVVSGILGLVGIASTFGLVTQEQGANLGAVGTAATTLVGAVVTAIASFRTHKQLNNGTFQPAPPPPAAQTAVEGIAAVANQFNDLTTAVAAGVQRVQDVAGGLAGVLGSSGLGALLPGSLAAQVAQQAASQSGGLGLFGVGPGPTPGSAIPTQ